MWSQDISRAPGVQRAEASAIHGPQALIKYITQHYSRATDLHPVIHIHGDPVAAPRGQWVLAQQPCAETLEDHLPQIADLYSEDISQDAVGATDRVEGLSRVAYLLALVLAET